MVSADPFDDSVVGILAEIPTSQGSASARGECLLAAMDLLHSAGFALVLVPAGTRVKWTRPRRWRWSLNRKERA